MTDFSKEKGKICFFIYIKFLYYIAENSCIISFAYIYIYIKNIILLLIVTHRRGITIKINNFPTGYYDLFWGYQFPKE